MNLIRLIVIGLIIYLLARIIKGWAANKNANKKKRSQETKMVRCDVCQLHIPEDEALQKNGHFYCSQQHLDKK